MAIQTSFRLYDEIDPAKKNSIWGNICITTLRRDWRPMVNIVRARKNKQLLLSQQSMDEIINSYKDKDFLDNTNFVPIGVMDNILKGMTEEILKNPPKAEIRATDPSAINLMKKDLMKLKARGVVEGDISKYNNQVGLPGYKVDYSNYKSNMEDFDKMGLDSNNTEDTNFFAEHFQRLNSTIALQSVLNNTMKINRVDQDKARKWVIDILSCSVNCTQTRVDRITGEIKLDYVYPEVAYGILNDSNDGHNDICKGWQDTKTVMEFLSMAGNEFDWVQDWPKLLWAINFFNGAKYTGFVRNGVQFNCFGNDNLCAAGGVDKTWDTNLIEWTLAYTYKVFVGYIEWNTVEATANYLVRKEGSLAVDQMGNIVPVDYSYDPKNKKIVDSYDKESYYQQQWYSSYFLATTSISQWCFSFGKVYYQNLYGANDEYSSGTFHYFLNEGRSAVEIAEPVIGFVNFAYYRLKWLIWHAKPEEDQVVLEELIQVAKGLQKLYNQSTPGATPPAIDNILNDLIKYRRQNHINVRAYPQIEGKPIAVLPQLEGKRNGLDTLAISMQNILIWAEGFIAHLIGWNPVRSGANPQARESFKSEQATLEASLNTTGYVYRNIQFLKERIATTTLNYVQDIIKFKDSIPYNWLLKLIGDDQFPSLSLLEDCCTYRYGIFVEDYNSNLDKQMILQAANFALQEKTLSFSAWFTITQTLDPKRAAQILNYQQYKAEKKARANQIQDKQIEDQMSQAQFERELQLIQEQGKIDLQLKQMDVQAAQYTADTNKEAKVEVKTLSNENEGPKAALKTESGKELAFAKEDAKQQVPFGST